MASNYEKGMYDQLMETMARLDSLEKESKKEITGLKDEIVELKTENKKLRKENQVLRNDNARLKSIINNDSSNTSLPPSTDQKGGKPANTYNAREKSERKKGGQKGHKGTTLTKSEIEEKIKLGECKHEIKNIGKTTTGKYVTKYVIDLSIEPIITEIHIYADGNDKYNIPVEYRSDVTYGSCVKALAVALYGEGVMSNDRIATFLNSASNDQLNLSEGSIYSFCSKLEKLAEVSIENLECNLLNQEVVATDATTVTVDKKQNYVRNFSVKDTVIYYAMTSKKIADLKNIEFLEKYAGILVHDHETALYHFGSDHGECNVHILRYLRKNSEDTKNNWSNEMITLLCDMNNKRKDLINNEIYSFDEKTIKSYEQKYCELIIKGRKENKKTNHVYAKKEELTLLNRLEKYSYNHLLFIHNFNVLFENNISERDLRKVKNRQKMAGGFRKHSGNKMYCSILTIIETSKKRKEGIIENIKRLFMGTPAIF